MNMEKCVLAHHHLVCEDLITTFDDKRSQMLEGLMYTFFFLSQGIKIPIMLISTKVCGTAQEMFLMSCHLNVVMLSTFSARYSMLLRVNWCKKRVMYSYNPVGGGGRGGTSTPFRPFVSNQTFTVMNYFVK